MVLISSRSTEYFGFPTQKPFLGIVGKVLTTQYLFKHYLCCLWGIVGHLNWLLVVCGV